MGGGAPQKAWKLGEARLGSHTEAVHHHHWPGFTGEVSGARTHGPLWHPIPERGVSTAGPKEPVQLPGTLPGLFLSGTLPSFEWRAPPLHHRTSEGSFKSMSHLAWALSPLGLGDCSIPILLTSAVVH